MTFSEEQLREAYNGARDELLNLVPIYNSLESQADLSKRARGAEELSRRADGIVYGFVDKYDAFDRYDNIYGRHPYYMLNEGERENGLYVPEYADWGEGDISFHLWELERCRMTFERRAYELRREWQDRAEVSEFWAGIGGDAPEAEQARSKGAVRDEETLKADFRKRLTCADAGALIMDIREAARGHNGRRIGSIIAALLESGVMKPIGGRGKKRLYEEMSSVLGYGVASPAVINTVLDDWEKGASDQKREDEIKDFIKRFKLHNTQ